MSHVDFLRKVKGRRKKNKSRKRTKIAEERDTNRKEMRKRESHSERDENKRKKAGIQRPEKK